MDVSPFHPHKSMIGGYISRLIVGCQKYSTAFFTFLFLFVIFLVWGISRLQISENIFSTFPEGEAYEPLNALLESKNISNRVVFSVNTPPETEDPVALAEAFADSLQRFSGEYLADITALRPEIEDLTYEYFYNNFPLLIGTEYYQTIDTKLSRDSIAASLSAAYHQLRAPGGAFLREYILNDPLFIASPFFQRQQAGVNSDQFIVEDGVLFTKDRAALIVMGRVNHPLGDSKKNELLARQLSAFSESWNLAFTDHPVEYFGTFEIAAGNASQIKKDTMLTAFIALLAILVILFGYYRKWSIPLYFILPAIFGGLFSLGVMGFLKPEISAISMATAAVILGIVLDYSFHFFTHLRHSSDVLATVREICKPLLTGSFTTILAFLALTFANSAVLQDFGLLAALSLLGAVIFTLIGLPVLLGRFGFDYKNAPQPFSIKLPKVSNKIKIAGFFGIIAITIGFLLGPWKVQFDGDLNKLNFHPEALKLKEQKLTGVNPANEKQIFLFASSEDPETAKLHNFKLYNKLNELKQAEQIESFQSSAPFQIPGEIAAESAALWLDYWSEKRESLFKNLDEVADSLGFTASAFDRFKTWITEFDPENSISADSIIAKINAEDLVARQSGKTIFITPLEVSGQQYEAATAALGQLEGVRIFDRSEVAETLLDLVRADFNYILIITALIVFITLLFIYGRIELTLLAFLPMLISWIWIVGIAGMLDIRFNFVNIVIATFIFGIGDDFSIFTTDGLLSRYKYGKDTLRAYRSAIVLSAITTIIGTGSLIFAKHPAVHSIALVSVIGLSCILFISLVFQPLMFGLFVQKRIEKRRAPVSFANFLMSVFGFLYFVIGCLLLQLILPLILLLPLKKLTRMKLLNTMLSKLAGTVINIGLTFRKRYYGLENFDVKKPSLIIANHNSFLDILVLLMRSPKVIMMVKSWVSDSWLFGPLVRAAGFIPSEGGAGNLDLVRQRISEGFSIVIFPEGTRSEDGKIGRFHKGAFYLAEELGLDITPVLISGASYLLPKNDFYIKNGTLSLKVLPRISADDRSWGDTYRERTKAISAYFKKEFKNFESDIQNARYLFPRIFKNYVFKGPVLEWYLRIKWKLEHANYDEYDRLIEDLSASQAGRKSILDLGCGYGYFSYFLHYRDPDRHITGVDYDEEKIATAQHGFEKNENLNFVQANVKDFSIKNQDVIFINDILHYMRREDQIEVLQNAVNGLNENGIIFIREGITDLTTRHKRTLRSEWFSTRLLGFNKTETELCFLSRDFIEDFAKKNRLSCKMKEQSATTSNVLFILQKI